MNIIYQIIKTHFILGCYSSAFTYENRKFTSFKGPKYLEH
jgi:hypothetical protein